MEEEQWRDRNPNGFVEVRTSEQFAPMWEAVVSWGKHRVRVLSSCPTKAKQRAIRMAAKMQETGL